ncbi:conserved hypothetical protein [Methanocaldococcus sp. FS406-22]|uniref:hypothetical protein n=1 Tax=Methanocaldococcus sp. (strain FS406-22) TaxID=644281 RepID=UPI0001BF34F6|nr:hypothetical protein [Methanocaldococcus sp. FS406-22]ADC69818.1 conserved hypothetical protein [Methanocaldococcus sp. FS406-22]
MARNIFQTNYKVWILKTIAVSVALGAVFWYSSTVSVTMNDIVTTIAKTPLVIVILIELIDKFVDMKDVYAKMYIRIGTVEDIDNSYKQVGLALLMAFLAFLGILWALTGTFTLSLGTLSPGVLIVSALYAIYILAPETGDDELILFFWIGATIATGGQYIMLLPPIPGLPEMPGVGTTLF